MKIRLTFVFTFVCFLGLADNPAFRSDSGIYGPSYQTILDQLADLERQLPDQALVYDYGTSVSGRTLRMLVIGKRNHPSVSRPVVQITGSIHGNEYLAIADKLPSEFLTASSSLNHYKQFINKGGIVLVVPVVNPDGYEKRRRYNSNGVDLNRDWDVPPIGHTGFKQVESKTLAQALINLKQQYSLEAKVTVDYHCCAGAVLYPWSFSTTPVKPQALQGHKAIGALAETALEVDYGTTGQILGYFPRGTTKDYYHAVHGALSFTYEGRYGREDRYLAEHVQWWESIFKYLGSRLPSLAFVDFFRWIQIGSAN